MDPNVKDILLVILGASSSLLGTMITLFFELRRDRRLAQMERKREEHIELVGFLRLLSSLSATVIGFAEKEHIYTNLDRQEYVSAHLNPLMLKLASSPLHGLPAFLMTKDKSVERKLNVLVGFESNLETVIKEFVDGRPIPSLVVENMLAENEKMNRLIKEILMDADRKLTS